MSSKAQDLVYHWARGGQDENTSAQQAGTAVGVESSRKSGGFIVVKASIVEAQ